MATMSGGGDSGECEAAAAANGRGEGAIHRIYIGLAVCTQLACRMTRVSGHMLSQRSASSDVC